ncbi:UDP-N-acetylmuramoyl-tripeptide--D-alanyl-D- alan ine ligase [Bifidobacterium italicum]|uniref:UDP-N-acetylmuramoyl-tripeptide--D-alanyl-D-alanine ligase n=1 Tax=Bifidobacterium italicum TaxID=1960968 RepID=A0A2A2ED90_9BIFI|nr:UDP-N-acetylmuramoyl-tripeptide--D-alanyl-D-alanine ligase [Bifidobacterium italicum]PAU66940.1 UDP-N-acetylmuramoyl-tripeptide--D-alanyl-D- alan ine ligase [Bifidobacterium italicum]
MMRMKLGQAARAVDGRLINAGGATAEEVVADVVTDSRKAAEGSLFVAIAGEHVDGHDFVARAEAQGALAAIVDHEIMDTPCPQIVVRDTVEALGLLAQANLRMRRESRAPFTVVGITGSVGKTTTKDLLKALLSTLGRTVAPVGSFNNEIGLPLTALEVDERTRYLIAEMGANHLGEIAHLTTIAPPDVAVVLKVGVAHLGEFGSVEHIAQAKSEIVRGLLNDGVSVLNADDARVAAMSAIAPGRVVWFGLEHAQAHDEDGYVAADDVALDDLGRPVFTIVDAGGVEQRVTLGIGGAHNVMNALAAAAVARLEGMPLGRIADVLSAVTTVSPHRMAVSEVVHDGGRFTLIDDSFNANPDSMRAGIDGLVAWRAQEDTQPYRVAVLGAMLELGDDEGRAHRDVGRYAIETGADALIAVGADGDGHLNTLAQAIADGARGALGPGDARPVAAVTNTTDADEAVRRLNAAHADMAVLLKGSHASGLSALATRWTGGAR